jgi:hypothetical protein
MVMKQERQQSMEVGAMPIVIMMLPTAVGKSPTITLILFGVVAKLHTSVLGLLSLQQNCPPCTARF